MALPELGSIEADIAFSGTPNDVSASADARENDKYNLLGGKDGGKLVGAGNRDAFWQTATVQESNWNRSFPFQFVLLEKGDNGYTIVEGQSFTLPIPPQSLTISTPFAIASSVTLGGYLEEHNGAPIRNITLQGTTGVAPARGAATQAKSFGALGSIFGGTLQGLRSVVSNTLDAVTSNTQVNLIKEEDVGTNGNLHGTTGYFQFMMLRSYLESYVTLKKTKKGVNFRLAFAIWKDKEFYLVTPISFDLNRSAASPLEYNYAIQLKAWRRWVPGQNAPPENNHGPAVRKANVMAQILSRSQAGRRALQSLKSTLTGFRADVDAVLFNPLRELGLYVKDAIGVGVAAGDLPVNIVRDMKFAILQAASATQDLGAFKSGGRADPGRVKAEVQDLGRKLRNLSVISGVASTGADPPVSDNNQLTSQGLNGNGLGANEADPANKLFDDPDKNADLFNAISVGSLQLSPPVMKRIVEERQRVQTMTRLDFETKRDAIVKLAADYADSIGVGDATYARTYGRPVSTSVRAPTDDDWEVLFHLNAVALEFNRLAASTATDDQHRLTAMEYIAGQASRAGIPFQVPSSAYSVPFPFGSTLEVLAKRYLGNPDRWHEIATLNNLRAPWVDEEGFARPLMVNGAGNDVQVTDIAGVTVGQSVWVSSSNQPRERRRVTGIRSLSPSVHVVSLDGEPDLSRFSTSAAAQIFTFLPGTVNSLQLIYIPSPEAAPGNDLEARPNPSIDEFTALLKVGGVDLLLTESGDLAITKDGDCRLAQGLANIVQRVRLALDTPLGSMMRHPDYGFGIRVGSSTADITASGILRAARATFASDPTFSGIISASIVKNGPSLSIGMNVGIAGYSPLVPLTFQVRR